MRRLIFIVLTVLALAGPAAAQTAWKPYEHFDFRHRVLTEAQFQPMTLLDLKYMRGLVFGPHGRRFDEAVIQNFLQTRPWYKPSDSYRVTDLDADERANMDRIKATEGKRHAQIEPGDLRFHQQDALTAKQLGRHSPLEWQIMGAEIEAWHGRRFGDQPWLQAYFAERYWYHPRPSYRLSDLSAAERSNLAKITLASKQQRRLALAPGDMGLFRTSPISVSMLHDLSLYELRLLRNEVFARHGARFYTDWLQSYFDDQFWYQPRLALGVSPALSPVEARNTALIKVAESSLHAQISEKPLPPSLLQNLSADDARKLRNEIYARHGRVFEDPWLRSYFQSQAWYKPNPRFQEAILSKVEQANIAQIEVYEQRGRTNLRQAAA